MNDNRYALDVMKEHSHLGLDNQHASELRDILLRHSASVVLLSRKPCPIPIAARDVNFNVVQSFDSRSVKDTRRGR